MFWTIPDWALAGKSGPPGDDHSHPAFQSDNVENVQTTATDDGTTDRGFASKLAADMVKSKLSGGRQQQSSNPLGEVLSSVLGGSSGKQDDKHSTGSDIGGMISSVLGGSSGKKSSHDQGNASSGGDIVGMISSVLGGGNGKPKHK